MKTRTKEPLLTVPNILSTYRILVFPLIMYFAFSRQESLFVIFLVINLITDILDGFIARNFNQQTEIGAKLDSIGDIGTYIAAFCGIYLFKWEAFTTDIIPFYTFLGFYAVMYMVSFIKFRKAPSLHLYFYKTVGWIHGIFFVVLFVFDFYLWMYYSSMILGILAIVEEILVLLFLKKMTSNAKGLYWVLKSQKND